MGRKHNDPSSKQDNVYPDGGIGWATVLGCFIAFVLLGGITGSVGILYLDIIDIMDVTKTKVVWISSLQLGFNSFGAVLMPLVAQFINYRKMTIIGGMFSVIGIMLAYFVTIFPVMLIGYGILSGFGLSMIIVASFMVVNSYFDKKRPLATAIGVSGAGIGMTIFPLLEEICLRKYGLKGTLLINAGIMLNALVCGGLYFPRKTEKRLQQNKTTCRHLFKTMCSIKLITKPFFFGFMLLNLLSIAGNYTFSNFAPQYIVTRGYRIDEASFIVSVNGIASSVGRLFAGLLANKFSNNCPHLYAYFLFGMGFSLFAVTVSNSFELLLTTSMAFGICSGAVILLPSVIVADLFGRELLSSSFGIMILFQGIGSFIGNPIAGALSDVLEDDSVVFYFGGIVCFACVLVLLPLICCKSRYYHSEKHLSMTIVVSQKCKSMSYLKSITHISKEEERSCTLQFPIDAFKSDIISELGPSAA